MNPRKIIADVAREYVGLRETSNNRGPHLETFWKATNYPGGDDNREPWCSAFVTYCVVEGDRRSPLLKLRKPPFFPAVSQWLPWSKDPQTGCVVFTAADVRARLFTPAAGDIVVFLPKLSHVGIVSADYNGSGVVNTVEGNTNEAGAREGDGVWGKARALDFCGTFIRVPALAVVA